MKTRIFGALAGLLMSAGGMLAQSGAETAQPAPVPPGDKKELDPSASGKVDPAPLPIEIRAQVCPPETRYWCRTEYLLWRFKSPPVPLPLVTSNNDPATIAALNDVGTTVLFGDGSGRSTNPGWFSGGRFALGAWIGDEQLFGWEMSGFLLERRGSVFNATGGAQPVVAIPINATVPFPGNPAGETSLNSSGFPNTVSVALNARLWCAEANGIVNLWHNKRFHLDGIVGFRYLDLLENLQIAETVYDPATNGTAAAIDGFGTRNQFYAGQVGARAELTYARWSFDTTVKVAFGSMHQVSNIAGEATVTNGAFGNASGVTAGGIFAEPSNIGPISRNVFAVAPEVTLQVGYKLTPRLRSFAGYNFLYVSNVLRPGNQIDRNINPTQNSFLVPPGTLTGPAAPTPVFHSSDFWAQGFNLGLEFRF